MISFIFSLIISISNAEQFKPQDYCILNGVITHETIVPVITCLKSKKKLFVDSGGGMLEAGDVLLRYVNKHKIAVLCLKCYSMAAFLWINADNKEFAENGSLMFHYAYTIVPEGGVLTIEEMRRHADELETQTENYMNCLSKENKEFFIKKMKANGNYFFGQGVLDSLGIKYKLISPPAVQE